MIFSHQTRGSIIQVLSILSYDAAQTFLYKHLGVSSEHDFLRVLSPTSDDALKAMLAEILANNRILYRAAEVKHVFISAVEELARWALHDGWVVENGALVRVAPATEEATGIRDKFLEDIERSGLDSSGAIKNAVEDSSKHFVAVPPDYNASATKVRIALETVARCAATAVARRKHISYPNDSWGKALYFLRSNGVIETEEEEILAKVYTFISPGAHIPKGVTAEEWARLARTFGLSSAYFLLRKYEAS
jgi:hypothetical protein